MTTRPLDQLQTEIANKELPLWRRVQTAIEYRIAQLPCEKQPAARQQLPFLVQFLPFILKHRKGFGLLQRVNPTIPFGGLTEYAKDQIYDRFPTEYRLTSAHILAENYPGCELLNKIKQEANITYPYMLKANVGERGVGIYYVADEARRNALLDKFENKTILRQPSSLQSYCDRPEERCIQFYRNADRTLECGSLVRRNIPFVVGDGKSTVTKLIGTLPLAPHHAEHIIHTLQIDEAELLDRIPASGQRVQIVRKASIDFGTTYTDLTTQLTHDQHQQLRILLHDLLQHHPDLRVGRFDLKAKSLEKLLDGEVKIIECNGSGAIPTHVYDENIPIQMKYESLHHHYDRMLQIALSNQVVYANHTSNKLPLLRRIETVHAATQGVGKKGVGVGKNKSGTKNKQLLTHWYELRKTLHHRPLAHHG